MDLFVILATILVTICLGYVIYSRLFKSKEDVLRLAAEAILLTTVCIVGMLTGQNFWINVVFIIGSVASIAHLIIACAEEATDELWNS